LTGGWSVTEQRLSRTIADPEVVQTEMTLGDVTRKSDNGDTAG